MTKEVKLFIRKNPSIYIKKIGKRTALVLNTRFSTQVKGKKIEHFTFSQILKQFNGEVNIKKLSCIKEIDSYLIFKGLHNA